MSASRGVRCPGCEVGGESLPGGQGGSFGVSGALFEMDSVPLPIHASRACLNRSVGGVPAFGSASALHPLSRGARLRCAARDGSLTSPTEAQEAVERRASSLACRSPLSVVWLGMHLACCGGGGFCRLLHGTPPGPPVKGCGRRRILDSEYQRGRQPQASRKVS